MIKMPTLSHCRKNAPAIIPPFVWDLMAINVHFATAEY
jgi:hypothetical protein